MSDDKPTSSCAFTYAASALAVVYLTLFILIGRHMLALLSQAKRKAQKIFLGFAALQCVCRTAYFILWPLFGDSCTPSVSRHEATWSGLLGTVPAAFFLSAFSVLTFTFSRIYHLVLRAHQPLQQTLFRVLMGFYAVLNVALYVLVLLEGTGAIGSRVPVMSIAVSAFLVSLGFLSYGVLLHWDMSRIMEAVHVPRRGSPMRHGTSSPGGSPHHGGGEGAVPNMFRIAVTAGICMFCFLVRSIVLPILESEAGTGWALICSYFVFAEIIPLCLMLRIFDTNEASGTETKKALRPTLLRFDHSRHHPVDDEDDDDDDIPNTYGSLRS